MFGWIHQDLQSRGGRTCGVSLSGRLVNGALPRSDGGETQLVTSGGGAPALGDFTGDGVPDAAAVINASGGAGGADEYVELYTNKDHLLRGFDPVTAVPQAIHAHVMAMVVRGGDVLLDWQAYTMTPFQSWFLSAHLHWDGQHVVVADLLPHTGVTGSGRGAIRSSPSPLSPSERSGWV
jgi:hypothetical protein